MQRIIILCVLMLLNNQSSTACNVCSSTSMGNSIGILPQFKSHFIGVRETYRRYESTHPASILNPVANSSKETYYNTELWGRWYPMPKLQVFAFLPINKFNKVSNQTSTSISGVGDASLLLNYLLYKTKDSSERKLKQALFVGSGIKLATGRYNANEFANYQLGTGSNDWLLNASYTLRYQAFGLMSEMNYKYNGSNQYHYQFGHKSSLNERVFCFLNQSKFSSMLYTAFVLEKSKADRLNGIHQDYTQGYAQYLQLGVDFYIKKLQIGASAVKAIKQNLGEGQIKEFPRLQFNLIYYFNPKSKC